MWVRNGFAIPGQMYAYTGPSLSDCMFHLDVVALQVNAAKTDLRPLLSRNVERFRGGLVFEAHRLLYHSTLGSRVIKEKKKNPDPDIRNLGSERKPRPERLSLCAGFCEALGLHIPLGRRRSAGVNSPAICFSSTPNPEP